MIKRFLWKLAVSGLIINVLISAALPVFAAGELSAQARKAGQARPEKTYTEQEIFQTAQDIVNWKKLDNGSTKDGYLMNNAYLEQAGSTPGDWYQIGMSRIGIVDDYDGYLAVIKDIVRERYKEPGKLSAAKATEWHRISLAILAAGGDPANFGAQADGKPINLIADGTYDRGKTASLGRQGINGWIWGLIAVDAKRYEIPSGAASTRDGMITEILRQQLTDGGFALTGKVSDPDITAMALQALAPYYNSGKAYTYTQKITGREITKTVKQIIDGSLSCLSRLQTTDGDFLSWGTQNVESTCQVTVALCCLGIDPQLDARFIKNGKTLLDGIMLYRMPDGGFVHSYTYDNENPTSLPDESNTMAGEQVLYTMAAVWRQIKGMRTLYDFRPEIGEADITGGPVVFTNEDKLAADSLPNPPATEQYVTVVKLLEKLEMSDVFEGKEAYRTKLESAKTEIDAIQKEIDSLNADIHAQLYPLESLTLVDRVNVNTIVQRYNALSPYDRTKIERWEDVIKTKTKLDNQLRGLIIGGVLLAVAMGVTVTVIMRVKKRKLTKRVAMEELAAEYGDEGE